MAKKNTCELYENILKTTKEIKTNIMLSLTDVVPFSSTLPDTVVKELDNLAKIDGYAIDALYKKGTDLKKVEGRGDYYCVEIEGDTYMTHVSKIPSLSAQVQTLASDEKDKSKCDVASDNFQKEDTEDVSKENEVVTVEDDNKPGMEDEMGEEYEFEMPQKEEVATQNDDVADEEPVEEETLKEYGNEQYEEVGEIAAEEVDDDSESVADNVEEGVEEPPLKAKIIGGDYTPAPIVSPMSRADVFVEEKEKVASEFVFDTYRISVCHAQSFSEDMCFMIAPLKIQRRACPTVPIIVTVFYKGKPYTVSSFDKNEDGRNIVKIEVNEYYFLCRGFFNEKGEFQSYISTADISVAQGDRMTVISQKTHRPTGSSVGNGHIKFRYTGEDGPGIVEIFPTELDENDFVIMTRCGEFVDYMLLSDNYHGLSRVILYDNGIKSEVVCAWNGECLEADIVPV